MSNILTASFANGYVSSRDHYDFVAGELARMLGAYYKPGDSRAWKMKGRTAFGTVLADNRIKGLALCQFDEGNDKLVAYAGTALYGATPGVTGTFSSLVTGLSASGSQLTACHQDDRWYLGNGVDRNKVLESGGTIRDMSLFSPATAPITVASNSVGSQSLPTTSSGNFTNPTFAYDADDATFASGTVQGASFLRQHTWSGWASGAVANRTLNIKWWLSGLPSSGDSAEGGNVGTGGVVSPGWSITVLLEKSEDEGVTWTPLVNQTYSTVPLGAQTLQTSLTADSDLVQFRATATYHSGTTPGTLRIRNLYINTGSPTAPFAVTDGIYYAVTWYNENSGMEGPPSEFSSPAITGTINQVLVTRPANPDAAATHWNLYRITDGLPATLANMGLLDQILIAETSYIDDFAPEVATDQLTPTLPVMQLGDLVIPRDSPAPAAAFMFAHDGSLCILKDTIPLQRELSYSEAGFPESFPEFYVVTAFALDEHDKLLCGTSLGRSAALFAEGAVLAVDGLPRVVDGQFNAGEARPLKGHPGCVGRMAMTPFSVAGEARAAWVSPYGVFQTNGETCEPLSLDIDWASEVTTAHLSTSVLKWHPELMVLEFCFDTDGDGANDRVAFIHMSPTHQKQTGQPKWSQPSSKKISALAGGLVGATYRRYSGHPSDGVVYLEASGLTDAATGEAVAMDIKTGKLGDSRVDSHCLKTLLLHSDWGDGATGTLTVTAHRESSGSSQSVTKEVRLNGTRGHEKMVARAGEKFDFQFTHDTAAEGAVLGVEAELERQGRSLSTGRWQTVSAE